MVLTKPTVLDTGRIFYEQLKDIVPVYPIIAENGSKYPFGVYRRTGINETETKDGSVLTEVYFEFRIGEIAYPRSVELAKAVMAKLDNARGWWEDLYVEKIEVEDASEQWINDAFIQTILFKITINKTITNKN